MVSNFHLPPMGYGPGSQPSEDGKELEYMPMPQDMRTYTTHFPEIEVTSDFAPAMTLLGQIADATEQMAAEGGTVEFDLSQLDAANRGLIAETMGEGEVAMRMHGIPAVAAQESVFAGIWGLKGADIDKIEVGAAPSLAQSRAHAPRRAGTGPATPQPAGVVNAPPLAVELFDKSAGYQTGDTPHVVNLTLLPHTEQDLAWLDSVLGQGSVEILSRGYGNCRLSATALPHVWRVQFFNSMDTLILDTFEVTLMPEVALAAKEDLIDSAERLREVMEAIR
ncbi:MAG: hydrogenase expression/formation protein [Mangrovicoccus sp.]